MPKIILIIVFLLLLIGLLYHPTPIRAYEEVAIPQNSPSFSPSKAPKTIDPIAREAQRRSYQSLISMKRAQSNDMEK